MEKYETALIHTLRPLTQTLIFDCCHSSNAARGGHTATNVRGIDHSIRLSPDDMGPWGLEGDTPPESKSLECSVLLSACGRYEQAGENPEGGLFTQELLKRLENLKLDDPESDWPTYQQIIESLQISER